MLNNFDTIKSLTERNAEMTNTKTMDFEKTPFKAGNFNAMKKKASTEYLNKISTGRIVWHLTKRHKFGLVVAWAAIVTINSLFPPVWDVLASIVR